jgi:transcriptional regulator with XRE-family HTH domain
MAELDMAQRIKDLRVSQNLTLEQVANEVGVGKSTVRK